MAIGNYTELQAAIAGWLLRTDLTDRLPEFIAIGEAKLNRKLRTLDQQKVLDVTIDAEYLALPDDWTRTGNISHDSDEGGEISYVTPQQYIEKRRFYGASGMPRHYTLTGRQMRFAPVPDAPYMAVHLYDMRVPSLTVAAPTNWLLTAHPDAYLTASLLAANTYLRDIEGVTLATAELADVIASIQQADQGDKTSTTPISRAKAI